MFTIQFGKTTKQKNSTKVPAISSSTVEIVLKDDTSIINPTFRIRTEYGGMASPEQLFEYNYCYCSSFKRYYYITNIVAITSKVFDIYCAVDVLATFRDDILQTKAFVTYAQSKYNTAISDRRLPITCRSFQRSSTTDIFFTDDDGSFALTLAAESSTGNTGAAQTYILDKGQMAEVASNLYSQQFFTSVIKELTNPLDAIISCKWTPIQPNYASDGGSTSISISGFAIGSGRPAKRTLVTRMRVDPYVHFFSKAYVNGQLIETYADYRNYEPYSEYAIHLPGVGLQMINMRNLCGKGNAKPAFTIEMSCSPCTGDITYSILRANDSEDSRDYGSNVMSLTGNFGVDVPVGVRNTGYLSAIANLVASAGSQAISSQLGAAGGAMATSYNINSAMSALSAVDTYFTTSSSVHGALGGWSSGKDHNNIIKVITRVFEISDNPGDIASTIGRPLFATNTLSSMQGLVICSGAYVKTWGTETEINTIEQLLNGGGVIIE